jgi:hypothetical protein
MHSPPTSNSQPLRNSQMKISIQSGLTRSKFKTICQITHLRSSLMCSPLLNSHLFIKLFIAWSIWPALKQSYMTAAPIVACVILDLTKPLIAAFTARSLAKLKMASLNKLLNIPHLFHIYKQCMSVEHMLILCATMHMNTDTPWNDNRHIQ